MSKRVRSDLLLHRRAVREKRGQGVREAYVPFIKIGRHEFSSHGLSTHLPSTFQARNYHLLSSLELSVVLYLEALQPSDLREQYPLLHQGVEDEFFDQFPNAEGTAEIARSLGIRHPSFSRNELRTMSTDIVANFRGGRCLPVHVKYQKDLDEVRNAELRQIESNYWKQRGTNLVTASEHSVIQKVVNNLMMLRSYQDVHAKDIRSEWLAAVIEEARFVPINDVLSAMAKAQNRPRAALGDRLKAAICRGLVRMDLSAGPLRWSEVWPPMQLAPSPQWGISNSPIEFCD